jgi:hypothetical protein
MVNVALMLAGFIVFALGVLAGVYLVFERQRGHLLFKPLTVKGNLSGNTPFALGALGAALVLAGWVMP